jgi:WD40 repeat protein
VAITIALTLTLSILLMMSTINTTNNKTTTTTMCIRTEKQSAGNYATGDWVQSVDISADGNYIAAGRGSGLPPPEGKVFLFDNSGNDIWNYTTIQTVYSVAVSSDGNYIAAGGDDSKVYFFNRTDSHQWNYSTGGDVWSVAVSSDGNYIAAGSNEENVYFFNRTGYLLKSLTTGSWVESVAISADGYSVAAGSRDNNVYFFESPYIDHPDDITYEPGTTGHSITWHPVDDDPKNYFITKDGAVEDIGSWSGESITISVDGLSEETYYFVCTVSDLDGKSESDSVTVRVRIIQPTIDSPSDIAYYEGQKGHFITWRPTDDNPSHFNITRDGDVVNSSSWDGGSITVYVDGLSVGTYDYECTVYDISGSSASDEVRVTVTEPEGDEFPWLQIVVTVMVIGAVVLYFKKKRK